MPFSFEETSDGLVFVADGFGRPFFWDGLSAQMEPVGIIAPGAAPVIGGSGTGAILGTYLAFVRFLDRFGNTSDLSPISNEYEAENLTGTVTGATNASPIVITSNLHSLPTGTKVVISGVEGNVSANGTFIITVLSIHTFSLDDSAGSAAYTSGGTWTAGVSTINYTSVPLPTEAKVTRRQILRNTDGQANVFYIDIDTDNLVATSFSSTRDDDNLAAQADPQTINDPNTQEDLANRHGLPPFHKAVLAGHLNRLFAAVEHDWTAGHVAVAFGSSLVTGTGTEWIDAMAGRFLYVTGATQAYEITAVDVPDQVLTLAAPYQGVTDLFAFYAIRPEANQERLIYFSEPSQFQSWPATNAQSLPHDGDRVSGLMPRGAFLYVLERRHVYKITFLEGPFEDGALFKVSDRGCINHRSWVLVDDVAFMLDDQGLHRFGGSNDDQSISDPIQDLFHSTGKTGLRINWRAHKWFHAMHYRQTETIRWFVTLAGEGLPRHAICYHYRLGRFWIEAYPGPIGGAALGLLEKRPALYLGQLGQVAVFWRGQLDGANPGAGTTRGTATSATWLSLADTGAAFEASAVNAPLVIVSGRGKGQLRRIVAATATVLTVQHPWEILPDSTSVYQVGGIPWSWRSGWLTLAPADLQVDRRLEVLFEPTTQDATMDLLLRANFRPAALKQAVSRSFAQGGGVKSQKDEPELTVDLTQEEGLVQQVLPFTRDYYARGLRYSQVELNGVGGQDKQALYQLTYEGAVPEEENR